MSSSNPNSNLSSNLSSECQDLGGSDYSSSSKKPRKFRFPLTSWVVRNNIKLVVFDKDGTLIEFQNYWCKWAKSVVISLVELYESLPLEKKRPILRSRGFPEDALYRFLGCNKLTGKVENQKGALCLGDMVIIKQAVLNFFRTYVNLSENDLQEYFDNAFKKAIDAIEGDIKALGSNPGDIKELFQELKDVGCNIAVFTSDVSYATYKALSVLGVNESFADNPDLILCSDSECDRRFEKPSGDALRYLANQVGLIDNASMDPDNSWKSQVLMVGDSKTDIISAQQAGVSSLFVQSGLFDENALRANSLRPDISAASVFEDIRFGSEDIQQQHINSSFMFMNKNNLNLNEDNMSDSSEAGL
jgi:phosphoglycolate phosphatase-like HAD superfamily hydrolase